MSYNFDPEFKAILPLLPAGAFADKAPVVAWLRGWP
jgi:hypothetical protein